jgi:hypothetical protein
MASCLEIPTSSPDVTMKPACDPQARNMMLAAAAKAKELLLFRRRRNEMFGQDLFGEPAWHIILELFIAKAEGRQVTIKSACIGSGVPMSTALRWVSRLTDQGVALRRKRDGRARHVLELDDTVSKTLEEMLLTGA